MKPFPLIVRILLRSVRATGPRATRGDRMCGRPIKHAISSRRDERDEKFESGFLRQSVPPQENSAHVS
jgi:hypothetical protein